MCVSSENICIFKFLYSFLSNEYANIYATMLYSIGRDLHAYQLVRYWKL